MAVGRRVGEMDEDGPKVQTSSLREISPGDVMYSMVTLVNNSELCI